MQKKTKQNGVQLSHQQEDYAKCSQNSETCDKHRQRDDCPCIYCIKLICSYHKEILEEIDQRSCKQPNGSSVDQKSPYIFKIIFMNKQSSLSTKDRKVFVITTYNY